MEMSEVTTEEVFEITDSSINIENETLIESSKRRYLPDLDESEVLSSKKFKEEDSNVIENDVNDLIDATLDETDVIESSQTEIAEERIEDTSTVEKANKSESILEEINSDGDEKNNDEDDDIVEDNGHVIDSAESEIDEDMEDEESEDTSNEESDDDALMVRAMSASKPVNKNRTVMENNDEPIALDSDSDVSEVEDVQEEEEEEEESTSPIFERNNPFPYSYRTRMLRYSPRFYIARKLLKRSIKISNSKSTKRESVEEPLKKKQTEEVVIEKVIEPTISVERKKSTEKIETADVPEEIATEINDQELPKDLTESLEKSPQASDPMQVDDTQQSETPKEEIISKEKPISEQKTNEAKAEIVCDQESEDTCSLLLTEISKNSIEDIMNRYIFNGSESNQEKSGVPVAMEEFAEKLFFCLQQNKHDIQQAQQIWNEKLHIKYKIREMMERIRRHRAVVDIESFGYKPAHDNPIVSSKSSTTNSEIDHFDKSSRMSTESVSRLIQDVRANVLKREDKQRIENHISMNANESFDESAFAHLQNLQANQGRQGQIIDVQSIINDFRSKNPQEIPRRGRRFKNSFGGQSSLMDSPYNRMEMNARNESYKNNNSPGFPEVSLLPVNSFYKNLPQSSGNSTFGQKSSLLQSILTKSTKSPVGLQHINNNASGTSSTLARLLTAPERERTLQNQTSRQMSMTGPSRQSNGEITITPIQPGSSRKQDYSMDDDENSTEGHLVIDESDYDMSDRKSELLLCQGCRRHKALFMCAGCSKQWYCSKECQELAWDDHAESCMV